MDEKLDTLVKELITYSNEIQWIEFKHNNYKPDMIGEDISALANGATLSEKKYAYMIWGIDDTTHEIVGTDRDLQSIKVGNEELENWLRKMLSKNCDFEFQTTQIDRKDIGIIIVKPAIQFPITFKGESYIRVGSYSKKLKGFPEIQAQLWEKLRLLKFEEQIAKNNLTLNESVQFLDLDLYFENQQLPTPKSIKSLEHYLLQENILEKQDNGMYSITNLGAILFAKKLIDFKGLKRKSIRIVQYEGNNKLTMLKERTIETGYVIGFNETIEYIDALTPSIESIKDGLRKKVTTYPVIAIREAVANTLIHQDFSITGTGPTIEIFKDRIEFTNPGPPLIDIKRIIDNPPRSRNEKLADLMRRLKICEELGTGWDKIVFSCEIAQLPAPKIEIYEDSTKVTIYSKKSFSSISLEDKLWACYLHACIKHVQGEQLTNKSLRERFGLKESSSGSISRLIKEGVTRHIIKPLDPDTAPRYMKYIPFWA
ncbi:MAG: putative DNA binding domain-containing protein [Absicoccus porci]|uniref:ATP-binding protein n=1 Tax=Absicoccus porci TaxID=2486576 RepID=UPI0023561180|nr:ATP-binding protein [Absicoccus porci]MCI6088834.1 putative DNA binding domain-containing protein [Absicoccus porci]MDY4739217.1 ATP-binding protein [Absicoccus porci]